MSSNSPDKIRQYYNQFTNKYLEIYGEVIQAFRPKHTKDLLSYIAASSGLKKNMKIVDAGCGVCGPAIYFAKKFNVHVDAITISDKQQEEAIQRVAKAGLERTISVACGDYHYLEDHYRSGSYDAVYFLESLGHSDDPEKALKGAARLLKPGGYIYIKDFYRKEVDDTELQNRIDRVIHNINVNYSYNTLSLTRVIAALRRNNLETDFVRKFNFNDDTSVRAAFESDLNIDIFEGMPEFFPAEWLEIRFIKPNIR